MKNKLIRLLTVLNLTLTSLAVATPNAQQTSTTPAINPLKEVSTSVQSPKNEITPTDNSLTNIENNLNSINTELRSLNLSMQKQQALLTSLTENHNNLTNNSYYAFKIFGGLTAFIIVLIVRLSRISRKLNNPTSIDPNNKMQL